MTNIKDPFNIIVCGTGGQGNVLLSRFLARSMARKDYQVTIGETFGASQRGGAVMSHVRLSRSRRYGALIPEGRADLTIGLEPMETIRVIGVYGNPEMAVISNVHPVYPIRAIIGENQYPDVEAMKQAIRDMAARCWFLDATRISLEMGNPILANMVMIGALVQTGEMNITKADMEDMIRETFAPEIAEANLAAARRGMESIAID